MCAVGEVDGMVAGVQLRRLLRVCALESKRAELEHSWRDLQVVQKKAKESQRESAGRESWRFGAFMRPETGGCGVGEVGLLE